MAPHHHHRKNSIAGHYSSKDLCSQRGATTQQMPLPGLGTYSRPSCLAYSMPIINTKPRPTSWRNPTKLPDRCSKNSKKPAMMSLPRCFTKKSRGSLRHCDRTRSVLSDGGAPGVVPFLPAALEGAALVLMMLERCQSTGKAKAWHTTETACVAARAVVWR